MEWEDKKIIYVGKHKNNCYKHPYAFVNHEPGKVHCDSFISFNELTSYIEGATIFKRKKVAIQDGIPKEIISHLNLDEDIKKLGKKHLNELLDCADLILWKDKMDIRY